MINFVVVVLDARERLLNVLPVVVLDQRDGAYDFLAAILLAVLHQLAAEHVGNGERTIVTALRFRHLIELLQQLARQRDAKSGNRFILHNELMCAPW